VVSTVQLWLVIHQFTDDPRRWTFPAHHFPQRLPRNGCHNIVVRNPLPQHGPPSLLTSRFPAPRSPVFPNDCHATRDRVSGAVQPNPRNARRPLRAVVRQPGDHPGRMGRPLGKGSIAYHETTLDQAHSASKLCAVYPGDSHRVSFRRGQGWSETRRARDTQGNAQDLSSFPLKEPLGCRVIAPAAGFLSYVLAAQVWRSRSM